MKVLNAKGKPVEYRLIPLEKQLYCPMDKEKLTSEKMDGKQGYFFSLCPKCGTAWHFMAGEIGAVKRAKKSV